MNSYIIKDNLKKIFCPDIMFNDVFKTCWFDNINNIDGIPIQKDLKLYGIYALDIKPKLDKDYFIFCLPINKDWSNEDFSKWNNPTLYFDIISSKEFQLNISLLDDKEKIVLSKEINIPEALDWITVKIPLEIKLNNIRLLSFSGSIICENILMKIIFIKEN